MNQKKVNNTMLEEAARRHCEDRCCESKNRAVKAAEALVCYYAGLYSPGKTDEDLKQAAYEGLLKALKRFEPHKGVMFSTYATHCIIGEIRHELRRKSPYKVPDWLKSLQAKVLKATESLAQKNGCTPTLAEIARAVNVTEEGIVEAMQAGCVPLEEVELERVRHLYYESFKLPIEDVVALKMSIEKMDNIQRKVIRLIFFEGLTQEQTARRLGLNQRKVSRIMHQGLAAMRLDLA